VEKYTKKKERILSTAVEVGVLLVIFGLCIVLMKNVGNETHMFGI